MVCKQTRGQIRSQTDWGTDDWSASRVRGRWNYSGGIHFSGLISCQNLYKLPPTTLSENTWNKEEKKRNWGESSWIMRRQGDTFSFFKPAWWLQGQPAAATLENELVEDAGNDRQHPPIQRFKAMLCENWSFLKSHIQHWQENIDSCAFVVITKN